MSARIVGSRDVVVWKRFTRAGLEREQRRARQIPARIPRLGAAHAQESSLDLQCHAQTGGKGGAAPRRSPAVAGCRSKQHIGQQPDRERSGRHRLRCRVRVPNCFGLQAHEAVVIFLRATQSALALKGFPPVGRGRGGQEGLPHPQFRAEHGRTVLLPRGDDLVNTTAARSRRHVRLQEPATPSAEAATPLSYISHPRAQCCRSGVTGGGTFR